MSLTLAPVALVVKNETAQHHAQAEALIQPLLSNIRSTGDYAALLQIFYGYYFPLQQIVSHYITTGDLPDIGERQHAALILQDLASVGVEGTPPVCAHLPAIRHTAEAFGALYVMEGSTLGGRMIARMLQQHAHLPLPAESLRFFTGYGAGTGPKWTAFQAALNRQQDLEAVVRAANETFLLFQQWIKHSLQHAPAYQH